MESAGAESLGFIDAGSPSDPSRPGREGGSENAKKTERLAKRLLVLKGLLAVQACQSDSRLIYMWKLKLSASLHCGRTNIELPL